jgi:tRNA threonylcarbamoyladenosine biosynthesis protein TsaE
MSGMSDGIEIELPDETATTDVARRLAPFLRSGDVLALTGDLGAGKTAFARALIRALTQSDEDVPSPTFTLLQTYESAVFPIRHFDLYRISHPDELIELDWDDAVTNGLAIIEWPDRAGSLLPATRLDLRLSFGDAPGARKAAFLARQGWADNRGGLGALQRLLAGE